MSFKTITLRNLDSRENENVVRILEAFMSKNDIKTGQTAIEEIIKDYDYMKGKCQRLENQISEMKEKNSVMYNAVVEENEKLKIVVNNFKQFQKSLNELS